jgi:hypothetical protein
MLTRRDWITGSSALALASGGGAFAEGQERPRAKQLVIDCHGHYSTEPKELGDYRKAQIAHPSHLHSVPAELCRGRAIAAIAGRSPNQLHRRDGALR